MITGLLFAVPPTRPSARSRLTEFKRKHGILTHRTDSFMRKEEPWLALLPTNEDKGKSVSQIMADSCRLYDESGYVATGTGELSAVRKLCELRGIECDL